MAISPDEASATLASMEASKRRLAAAADCPPQRHLAFAAVMGTLVSLPGFPIRTILALEGLVFAGILLIVLWDRRRTGMFINGYRSGRTRPLTFAMLATLLVLVALSALLKAQGIDWAPFAVGALSAGIAYLFSVRWQQIFRAELGAVA